MNVSTKFYLFVFLFPIIVNDTYAKSPAYCFAENRVQSVPYDSLRRVLEEMYDTDQGIREKIFSPQSENKLKPEEQMKLVGEMQRIDSVNQQQLEKILATYGWLPRSKIGEKASDAIFFVVQHSNQELMRQYLPNLQRLADKNEARRTHAALMEDRLLMWEGKKQIYGTQAHGTPDRRPFIWPIQNPATVNERRQQAGFDLTVEENAKRLNATYNPDEPLPEKNNQ